MRLLIKILVALVAIGVLGILFVRSALNTRSEPYEIARTRLSGWTLAIDAVSSPSGILLALRPQPELTPPLFSQVFARSGDSLSGPTPSQMPLILQSEYDRTMAGAFTPDALLALARTAGLESSPIEPRCMAHRRVSQPGSVRQVFFLRFVLPAFEEFRRQVGKQVSNASGPASTFNPAALSPVMIVAAADADFSRWLPLQPGAEDDCLAPIIAK